MRAFTCHIVFAIAALGCGKTIVVPLDLNSDDESCESDDGNGGAYLEGCAESVRVEVTSPDGQPASTCIELGEISSFEALESSLTDFSLGSFADGDRISVSVTVFSAGQCTGATVVSGTSVQTSLAEGLQAIPIELRCFRPDACNGDEGDGEITASVVEFLAGEGNDEPTSVTAGYIEGNYAAGSTLTMVNSSIYRGPAPSSADGCLSIAVSVDDAPVVVTCQEAIDGSISADTIGLTISANVLRTALSSASLGSGDILGLVIEDGGGPAAGVTIVADGEGEVLYFQQGDGAGFGTEGSTNESGIFAVRSAPGSTTSVSAGEATEDVPTVSGAISATRLVVER